MLHPLSSFSVQISGITEFPNLVLKAEQENLALFFQGKS